MRDGIETETDAFLSQISLNLLTKLRNAAKYPNQTHLAMSLTTLFECIVRMIYFFLQKIADTDRMRTLIECKYYFQSS